jgi:hydroxylamine reductase
MEEEKKEITRQTNIAEAMNINPFAEEILMEAGLGCIGCMFSQAENLEQGLMTHGFGESEIDEIIKELNR